MSVQPKKILRLRVKARKMKGGHDVPEDKVRSRYDRSMDFMFQAALVADKSYFFDNSSAKKDPKVIAQVENSGLLPSVQIYGERPNWFIKYFSIKLLEYYAALDS